MRKINKYIEKEGEGREREKKRKERIKCLFLISIDNLD